MIDARRPRLRAKQLENVSEEDEPNGDRRPERLEEVPNRSPSLTEVPSVPSERCKSLTKTCRIGALCPCITAFHTVGFDEERLNTHTIDAH
jgi:hypothetical protein